MAIMKDGPSGFSTEAIAQITVAVQKSAADLLQERLSNTIADQMVEIRTLKTQLGQMQEEIYSLNEEISSMVNEQMTERIQLESVAAKLKETSRSNEALKTDAKDELVHDFYSHRSGSMGEVGKQAALEAEVKYLRDQLKKQKPDHHKFSKIRENAEGFAMQYHRVDVMVQDKFEPSVVLKSDYGEYTHDLSFIWAPKGGTIGGSKYGVVRHSLTSFRDMQQVEKVDLAKEICQRLSEQMFQLIMETRL